MPKNFFVDHRAAFGLGAGILGLICGVVAEVASVPVLGVAAGVLAVVAPVAVLPLAREVRDAEKVIAGAAAISTLRELQLAEQRDEDGAIQRMVDAESGLPDQNFFELALESRLAAARRRLWPICVVELELFPDQPDNEQRMRDMVVGFAGVARLTLRGSDIACRVGTTSFALILEDTDERGGDLAVRRLIHACSSQEFGVRRLAAGVASYPNHGLTAQDVLSQAWIALGRACAMGEEAGGGSTIQVARLVDQATDQAADAGPAGD
jgi:diguanylate cyclase (GGDEF)-like protein